VGFTPLAPVSAPVSGGLAVEPPALVLDAPDGFASNLAQLRPAAEPLDLALDQIALEPPAPGVQDELLLDAAAAPVTSIAAARKTPAEPEPAPAPAQQGTTLFERMASLSRGRPATAEESGEAPAAEAGGTVSFPRFLSRQNNQ
jgi:cell division protein FtsZ